MFILEILGLWVLVSVILGTFVGKFIKVGQGPEISDLS